MDVQYEDVVCRLFPYTFVGQAYTWFFSVVADLLHHDNNLKLPS